MAYLWQTQEKICKGLLWCGLGRTTPSPLYFRVFVPYGTGCCELEVKEAICVGKATAPESPGVVSDPLLFVPLLFYCFCTITLHSPIVSYCLHLSHSTEMSHLLLLTLYVCHTVFQLTSDVVTPSVTSEVCYLFFTSYQTYLNIPVELFTYRYPCTLDLVSLLICDSNIEHGGKIHYASALCKGGNVAQIIHFWDSQKSWESHGRGLWQSRGHCTI